MGSFGKSVPFLEQPKDLCSTDQLKLCGNSSSDEKVDDADAGKVDTVAARKVVTPVIKGAEMKKPWCQLISEFPQGPIWREVYQRFFHTEDSNTNSRSLVKGETTPSTALLNPTVEISKPRFMAGAGNDLPEDAMMPLLWMNQTSYSLTHCLRLYSMRAESCRSLCSLKMLTKLWQEIQKHIQHLKAGLRSFLIM